VIFCLVLSLFLFDIHLTFLSSYYSVGRRIYKDLRRSNQYVSKEGECRVTVTLPLQDSLLFVGSVLDLLTIHLGLLFLPRPNTIWPFYGFYICYSCILLIHICCQLPFSPYETGSCTLVLCTRFGLMSRSGDQLRDTRFLLP